METSPNTQTGKTQRFPAGIVVVLMLALLAALALAAYVIGRHSAPDERVVVRPTGTVLMAVRDLARLETNELHLEKVIDLTDKQSRLFGLLDTSDAILLVAAGDVTIGVDLTKLDDGDVAVDREKGTASVTLPAPEVLSTRLDEEHTYVYRRTTGLLAQRNEHLETRARQEAVHAIEQAALDAGIMDKAKKQAERQLQSLLEKFGVRVVIGWRPA